MKIRFCAQVTKVTRGKCSLSQKRESCLFAQRAELAVSSSDLVPALDFVNGWFFTEAAGIHSHFNVRQPSAVTVCLTLCNEYCRGSEFDACKVSVSGMAGMADKRSRLTSSDGKSVKLSCL